LAQGGTSSGAFNPGSGAVVEVSGGTYVLDPSATLGGAGEFLCSGATVTNRAQGGGSVTNRITGGVVYFERAGGATLPNLVLTGGELWGSGGVTVGNAMVWTGGQISSVGGVTANGTLLVSGGNTKCVRGGVLRNGGGAQWTQGTLYVDAGGTLSNRLGGTFDITFDGTVGYSSDPAGAIYNAGLWRKTGGTNVASINVPFHNGGTLSLWQGTLNFAPAPSLSPTGTIEFALGGTDYPTNYGRITTSQTLQLAGRLAVVFRGGFVPGPSQQYAVVAAPILGTFQSFTAPTISSAIFLNPLYQPNAVQLVTTDATPSMSKLVLDGQSRFTLEIHGIASQLYVVEASTNFVVWTPLATNTMPASTVWQFVDEDSVKFPYRFYRVQFRSQSVTPSAPTLTLTRSNNTVIVSWPLPAEGWVLEWTNALPQVSAPWPQIPPPYQTNGANLQFTEPVPLGSKFYRLHKP
jgi:hypothetical protein